MELKKKKVMQVLGKSRALNPAVPTASTLELEPEQPETGGLDDPVVPVDEFTDGNYKSEKLKNLRNLRRDADGCIFSRVF